MLQVLPSIACNLDSNILKAALPLFASEKVQAIEWSFDTLFKFSNIPPWFIELLEAFSEEKRLIGHGVFFSLFSGKWKPEQENWLNYLKEFSQKYQFDHITEHFGFMTGENFHKGAPISIPFTNTTLALGQDRLKRIYESCHCPVGLENLAIAYSIEEVKRHGAFLEKLIEPINGFIILDLHNLYCQIHNFELSLEDLLPLYPLDRVREIHVSGGSWEESTISKEKKVRRDTHDDAVPTEVFDLLKKTIGQCPNLKYVVLEQLGPGLNSEESRKQFQDDFLQMEQIIQSTNLSKKEITTNTFMPKDSFQLGAPIEDSGLYAQQMELSNILETAADYQNAQALLQKSSLANTAWEVEKWEPHMLETVVNIAQKWKEGFK